VSNIQMMNGQQQEHHDAAGSVQDRQLGCQGKSVLGCVDQTHRAGPLLEGVCHVMPFVITKKPRNFIAMQQGRHPCQGFRLASFQLSSLR